MLAARALRAVTLRVRRHTRCRVVRVRSLSAQSIEAIRASLDAALTRLAQRLNSQMVWLTVAIAGGQFIELLDPADAGLGWLAASADDVREGMTDALRAAGKVADGEVLLVLLSSHGEPPVITANLAGPVAVAADGTARQLILEDPDYDLRAPVGRLAPEVTRAHTGIVEALVARDRHLARHRTQRHLDAVLAALA